jgi:hypothetical protein
LKKELKVLEIVKGEPLESGVLKGWCDLGWVNDGEGASFFGRP